MDEESGIISHVHTHTLSLSPTLYISLLFHVLDLGYFVDFLVSTDHKKHHNVCHNDM